MQVYASLLSTNAREQWEKCFDQEYIQPVLSVSGVVEDENKRDMVIVFAHVCAHTHTHTHTHTYNTCVRVHTHTQALEKEMGDAMHLILSDKKESESYDPTQNT